MFTRSLTPVIRTEPHPTKPCFAVVGDGPPKLTSVVRRFWYFRPEAAQNRPMLYPITDTTTTIAFIVKLGKIVEVKSH